MLIAIISISCDHFFFLFILTFGWNVCFNRPSTLWIQYFLMEQNYRFQEFHAEKKQPNIDFIFLLH